MEKLLLKISKKNQILLKRNIEEFFAKLQKILDLSKRSINEINILPVTKKLDEAFIPALYQCGFSSFGESRPLELTKKMASLSNFQFEWHFIGHLQTNKVHLFKDLNIEIIHSIDREKILDKLSLLKKKQKIFLQVNISKEETKQGFSKESINSGIEKALSLDCFDIQGLMTMAPKKDVNNDPRKYFSDLRILKEKLEKKFDIYLPHLSMGMSGDFEEAVLEGATYLRIGSLFFKDLV